MTVVVNALDCVTRRTWPHVFQESRKVVNPLRADRNTARAVVGIVLIVWAQAATLHGLPRSVFAGHSTVARVAVDERACAAAFDHAAATTGRFATFQTVAVNGGRFAAIAAAIPAEHVAAIFGSREHFKAAESSACQINYRWRHTTIITRKDMRCYIYHGLSGEGT